jgi:hypothetical protein
MWSNTGVRGGSGGIDTQYQKSVGDESVRGMQT